MSRTLDEILTQAFTDGQSDTMWQNERYIEIFATAKAEIQALITEARANDALYQLILTEVIGENGTSVARLINRNSILMTGRDINASINLETT